jgi:hypothetical protein
MGGSAEDKGAPSRHGCDRMMRPHNSHRQEARRAIRQTPGQADAPVRERALARLALAETLVEKYVWWREESASVTSAYGRWLSAPAPDQTLAFAVYLEALDREEQAAHVLRETTELVKAAGK